MPFYMVNSAKYNSKELRIQLNTNHFFILVFIKFQIMKRCVNKEANVSQQMLISIQYSTQFSGCMKWQK